MSDRIAGADGNTHPLPATVARNRSDFTIVRIFQGIKVIASSEVDLQTAVTNFPFLDSDNRRVLLEDGKVKIFFLQGQLVFREQSLPDDLSGSILRH